MTSSPHEQSTIRPPHLLAVEIASRLAGRPKARILDYCSGSGRNTAYLRAAGFDITAVSDSQAAEFDRSGGAAEFAGIVSSHGLLHGFASEIPARIEMLAGRLEPGGWMCATFGSQRDARYGSGMRLGDDTFAAVDGDEPGVAHAYVDEASLRRMLEPFFELESLNESDAGETAGSWAHASPLSDAVHWIVIGRRHQ
jgi:SAM-dependent methyltransferase